MTESALQELAVFAPHPLLTVTLDAGPDIHFHAGGQGVWVARMMSTMGAAPVLCGFLGGETGELLGGLVQRTIAPGHARFVETVTTSGCYVTDLRTGELEVVAMALGEAPSRHELDELFSLTCAQAVSCGWLVVTNPLPADALPLEVYGDLVADSRTNGVRTLVDLSSPRLDSALRGRPDVVKLNAWELAEFVRGPVSTPRDLLAAATRLHERGAGTVIVTRAEEPALVLHEDRILTLTAPRFDEGHREGCGDSMMGAMAAAWATGESFEQGLRVGAAAGAANFLRRGLGSATREVVEGLLEHVTLEPGAPAP
jgi:1-phosphofructokinase